MSTIGQKAIGGLAACGLLGVPVVVGVEKLTEVTTAVIHSFTQIGGEVGNDQPADSPTATTIPK